MLQQNRIPTEQKDGDQIESVLKAVVTQASRQNLLPKIMWRADKQFGSRKLLDYQKSVHRKYDNDLKTPLKYDPEAAKSERQKFREKVIKLVNNQLEVEYFQNIKVRDKTKVTYQGHEIEEEKIPTKKQYQIFKNFNQKRFKETYVNIFDDKLQVEYPHLYHNRSTKRCHTLNLLKHTPSTQPTHIKTEQSHVQATPNRPSDSFFQLPKTSRKKSPRIQTGKKRAVLYLKDKKVVGKQIAINQKIAVQNIMRQIGGFTHLLKENSLCLTKQSISRWLKGIYEKPARIVDFLQFKEVVSFEEFWKVSRRLRVMPQDHILFMTFLYYDGNNDGYICDYDLQRLSSLGFKRLIINHDYQKLKSCNIKKILTKKAPYLDLYKRSQISESIYFEWKKQQEQQGSNPFGLDVQMKNRLLSSKQKQVFLDFSAFSFIYKNEKPYLWYDLMHLFAGTTFAGLNYN